MAHIGDGDSGGRSTNVDLNLVPIIDLMSVCIIFLLITAVWTQVSMIQIGSSIYGKKNSDEKQEPPPPKVEIPFRLDVKADGYHVIIGKQNMTFPKKDGAYDSDKLLAEVKKIKELYPDKNDAIVTVSDDLPYDSLIGGMDALLQGGFPEIAVATGGAG